MTVSCHSEGVAAMTLVGAPTSAPERPLWGLRCTKGSGRRFSGQHAQGACCAPEHGGGGPALFLTSTTSLIPLSAAGAPADPTRALRPQGGWEAGDPSLHKPWEPW